MSFDSGTSSTSFDRRVRARHSPVEGSRRIVLNVGGTRFTTTIGTVERSQYLNGMIETQADSWDEDIGGDIPEIFVDRDPTLFQHLLRLMRQLPVVALPMDDLGLVASLLAEADFFGVEGLLAPVKARAFYNTRVSVDDLEPFAGFHSAPSRAAGEAAAEAAAAAGANADAIGTARGEAMRRWFEEALEAHLEANRIVNAAFSTRDEEYDTRRFDAVHGSVAEALASGVLPRFYFDAKPSLSAAPKILQLQPIEATTWFLIGDLYDSRYMNMTGIHVPPGDSIVNVDAPLLRMDQVMRQPGLVRRVACFALLENSDGARWMEPMVHVAPEDQEWWLNDQPGDVRGAITSRFSELTGRPARLESSGLHSVGQRTMIASDWVRKAVVERYGPPWASICEHDYWTQILVAETPPPEVRFSRVEP